jgi:hypothetical protein
MDDLTLTTDVLTNSGDTNANMGQQAANTEDSVITWNNEHISRALDSVINNDAQASTAQQALNTDATVISDTAQPLPNNDSVLKYEDFDIDIDIDLKPKEKASKPTERAVKRIKIAEQMNMEDPLSIIEHVHAKVETMRNFLAKEEETLAKLGLTERPRYTPGMPIPTPGGGTDECGL